MILQCQKYIVGSKKEKLYGRRQFFVLKHKLLSEADYRTQINTRRYSE